MLMLMLVRVWVATVRVVRGWRPAHHRVGWVVRRVAPSHRAWVQRRMTGLWAHHIIET